MVWSESTVHAAVTPPDTRAAAAAARDSVDEGARIMTICNACRYCEGFCAVFPAMERRFSYAEADLNYLANLCHNCTECLHACQYGPPHPFDVNVPKTLAQIRQRSYEKYCWPQGLGALYRHSGMPTVLGLMGVLLVLMLGATAALGPHGLAGSGRTADFYGVLPHVVLASVFGAVFLFVLAAMSVAVRRYLADTDASVATSAGGGFGAGLRDAFSLKYLHGSNQDCSTAESLRTPWRRLFHHFTFYGFLSCFAATSVGTVYHVLGHPAPYPLLSLPVILGTAGGIGLLVGPLGLALSRRRRDPTALDPGQQGLDRGFILALLLTSVTGLALLAARATPAMGWLLVVHLAAVMTLFLTLPYGKFVHGLYRTAALVQYARESRSSRPDGAPHAVG
jgi:citrate/tricarballylate utilization protein